MVAHLPLSPQARSADDDLGAARDEQALVGGDYPRRDAASRPRRFRGDEVRFGERSGHRASPCGGRPRRTREAYRRKRCELARLVCRVHGRRASRHGAAAMSDYDVIEPIKARDFVFTRYAL